MTVVNMLFRMIYQICVFTYCDLMYMYLSPFYFLEVSLNSKDIKREKEANMRIYLRKR